MSWFRRQLAAVAEQVAEVPLPTVTLSLPPSLPLSHAHTHSQVVEVPLPTATPAASIFSAAARHVTATHWKRMTMDEVRVRGRERVCVCV